MEENEHLHEDGRDQDDIGVEIEPTPLPSSPDSDPNISFLSAAAAKYQIKTVNFARIRDGQPDEAVPECHVTIGGARTQTNAYGNAEIDLSGLPDGQHNMVVRAPETSAEIVGPDFVVASGVDYVWREVEVGVQKAGSDLSVVSDTGQVEIRGRTMRVGLDPLWMRSKASSPRGGTEIDTIVIHHTGSNNLRSDVGALVYSGNVSSHYLIPPSGKTIKLVPESRRAWHAGYAHWLDAENINSRSIGIEITNSEKDYEPEQISAVVELVGLLLEKFDTIPNLRVIGHSDTAITHPDNRPPTRHGRKSGDPSSTFPWEELEANGWGLVPYAGTLTDTAFGNFFAVRPSGKLADGDRDSSQVFGGEHLTDVSGAVAELQQDLASIGYYLGNIDGAFGGITRWAVRVFQQHMFSGSRRTDPLNSGDGKLDIETATLIKRVLGQAEVIGS